MTTTLTLFFCSLLYNQDFSHFLFKHFLALKNKVKGSSKHTSSHIFYLYAFSRNFLLKKLKSNYIVDDQEITAIMTNELESAEHCT